MRTALLSAFLMLSLSACASAGGGHWVELEGKRFQVEVAADDAARARGLMFRDSLPQDHGMLFIHDVEEPQAYWMKNCKFPQDMLFFDSQRTLVAQQRDVPACSLGDACPSYPSEKPAKYVLELNAGQAAAMNLKDGAKITFGPGIPAK